MKASTSPRKASENRQERAENVTLLDVREISGEGFEGFNGHTVYEVDLRNENGERRENIVIIPRILFENTKDVRFRHDRGVVGKYTRALAEENEDARQELIAGIEDKMEETQEEIRHLREKDALLRHTKADVNQNA